MVQLVECQTRVEGLLVRDSQETLSYVLEQDTLSTAGSNQEDRKKRPNISKNYSQGHLHK